MINEFIINMYFIAWGLLVFTVVAFFVSGVDDLFFDVYYWVNYIRRAWILRRAKPLEYHMLQKLEEKKIAVMVPCWHEAGVIEQMLKYNIFAIDYDNYDFFVGVYSNDPETVKSVQSVEKSLGHIYTVINEEPGPTNKARNLNAIYEYIMVHEQKNQLKYDIFILHDSEDIIHSLGFKFFNYLMPKNHMVQIPIFPLQVPLRFATHWTYAAEFTEIHTKDILVREAIGGLVPSAGVGTAFTRGCIDILKSKRDGKPFSVNTLTEDYSTALQIKLLGLREIFATQYVYHTVWKKRFFFFGQSVARKTRDYIATRALFPTSYMKAVRQKTRWILGISFQEWINTGWGGNLATMYTLCHDRKAIFTHLVNGLFIIQIPFWIFYSYWTYHHPQYPTLQDLFERNYWVWVLIVVSSFLMLNRIVQRVIAVLRVYGIIPAFWTIPLILYANVINLHALLRAYFIFFYSPKAKTTSGPKWDKTDHEFPAQHSLIPYRQKLGDLLVEKQMITSDELQIAIGRQTKTGERLGTALIRLGYIDQKNLKKILAEQYDLNMIDAGDVIPLEHASLPLLSKYQYDQLKWFGCLPYKIQGDELTLIIEDPSDEITIARALRLAQPYKVKFLMSH